MKPRSLFLRHRLYGPHAGAGRHRRFSADAMDMYFTTYRESVGISREEFLALGQDPGNPYGFNVAVLAVKMASTAKTCVNKLHGK